MTQSINPTDSLLIAHMNQFLTRQEVVQLTGCAQRTGQRANLARNNITFTVGNDGWPRVTWYQVNHRNLSAVNGSVPADAAPKLDNI